MILKFMDFFSWQKILTMGILVYIAFTDCKMDTHKEGKVPSDIHNHEYRIQK
ncbi:MAG: hypothetical protein H7A24_05200 [Leptospiraceae bacterium]|nr:hypothetical protein [Leptospiraceae bacterium]MCP5511254.1 hypothetical protein [Leptospiraceae bacterium]